MSSNGKDGVVTLGGRDFKRVKAGLDEAQVASFIDDLIRERDVLEGDTSALTDVRDKLAAELAKVSGATVTLQKELDALDMTIEKAETVSGNLSAKKAVLAAEKKTLTADSRGLQARQKKCKADIVRLTALKNQLIS